MVECVGGTVGDGGGIGHCDGAVGARLQNAFVKAAQQQYFE